MAAFSPIASPGPGAGIELKAAIALLGAGSPLFFGARPGSDTKAVAELADRELIASPGRVYSTEKRILGSSATAHLQFVATTSKSSADGHGGYSLESAIGLGCRSDRTIRRRVRFRVGERGWRSGQARRCSGRARQMVLAVER